MWIVNLLQSPLAHTTITIVWPALVSLLIFNAARKAERSDLRLGPLLEVLDALDGAEKAVRSFHVRYANGYKSDEEFVSDATLVFSKCSAFLNISRDVKKRVLLGPQMQCIDSARESLVRELLAIRYDDKSAPFPHGENHIQKIAAALKGIELQVAERP
ncbi:hypothetical protein [Pseudoxanthomonas sp. CF125]|uniref:hypothetical protein n=1 Tax=Pseudoxanthomonas sp. CF125 TaxID=1855303 RepID=UPI00089061E6|nr:hypothetical protein [Pseudoxanthomonas sp. CF125]SDQ84781.1 hypothetical protein SAMN05216569_2287 [Pseudoxanthomonas sp. CF125]